ncbi:MAG: hypothetical protein GY756_21890 [bacterium]|nr:hypothetical protein [bacterium]
METNICPFCTDEISVGATVCEHCGETITKNTSLTEAKKSDELQLNYLNHEKIVYQLCKSMLNKNCTV